MVKKGSRVSIQYGLVERKQERKTAAKAALVLEEKERCPRALRTTC